MRVITSARAMQRWAIRQKAANVRVGFVPTMGALHAGHLSLVRLARRRVGARGRVVVSVFVNPTQFGPGEDFRRYPRDLGRDCGLCRGAGVDVVFAPSVGDMYPGAESAGGSTYVVEEALSRGMEGASRPTHFRGVTTVVAKLFHLVLPDVAVFGAKDYQQAAVVKRMVRDLHFPLRVVVGPTRREPGGLAMSSRNDYLAPETRVTARRIFQSIQAARRLVRSAGPRGVATARVVGLVRGLIESGAELRVDYVACVDAETLIPVSRVTRGTQLALAVRAGGTRLIDNGRL